MSEEPQPPEKKKKKGPPKIGVPVSGRAAVLRRLQAAEQAKLGTPTTGLTPADVAPAPVVEGPIPGLDPNAERQRLESIERARLAKAAREQPQAPVGINLGSSEQPIDYDKIFNELERQTAAKAETAFEKAEAESLEGRALLAGEEENSGLNESERARRLAELERLRPAPTPEETAEVNARFEVEKAAEQSVIDEAVESIPAANEIFQEERKAYRRFERRNSEALRHSLRALSAEEATINAARLSNPRFAAWYARHRTQAMTHIEEYYKKKLLDDTMTIDQAVAAFSLLSTNRAFDQEGIDHMTRHVMAFWVQQRRIKAYERRGLVQRAADLADIYKDTRPQP